ncbi:hypothetical protein ACOYW6_09185 [Parablastomonas sp. CN1-191]|uniref:hypothetical protein n=1 Tax=Parablastomonas sp. CN1-191 TaxID=3400908 RepID=UPI003BF82DF3
MRWMTRWMMPAALAALAGSAAIAQDTAHDMAPTMTEHGHPAPPPSAPAALPTPATPAAGHADHMGHDDGIAPKVPTLLPGYGGGGFAVTTAVPRAQAFFANGLELHAAFAHTAAIEAMTEAVRLDPACAMCLWGEALTRGPTINFGKDAKERKALRPLVRRAAALAARTGTPREKALIAALDQRYRPGAVPGRDRAYADAMKRVGAHWPQDDDVAVLADDAAMVALGSSVGDDPSPDAIAAAKAKAGLIAADLERVLARSPRHTPAIHFYIHATEIAGEPERAERYADTLGALAPSASHLVHMPSHTYYWVGRYEDAAQANARAVELGKANAARLGLPAPSGVWGLPYHSHNVIFGLGGALMAGDPRIALDLARPLVERVQAQDKVGPFSALLSAHGYYALARFDPAAVPALPEPRAPYLKAVWHYARGEAAIWRGDVPATRAEIAAIPAAIAAPGKQDFGTRSAEAMLTILRGVLDGRIAMHEGRWADAAAAFRTAAVAEESTDFMQLTDPPAFWYPVRRDLAAALLAAGDKAGALKEIDASLALRKRDPEALALRAKIAA